MPLRGGKDRGPFPAHTPASVPDLAVPAPAPAPAPASAAAATATTNDDALVALDATFPALAPKPSPTAAAAAATGSLLRQPSLLGPPP
jgi:hypothetical protein